MKVEPNKVVSLTYVLHSVDKDGKVEHVETADANRPLTFLFGVGQMLPKFEEGVYQLAVGEKFSFKIPAIDGYGVWEEESIVTLPGEVFTQPGKSFDPTEFELGDKLPMQDQNGNHFNGTVTEITPEGMTLDFNHELAGFDLMFEGSILELRDATADELAHGHVHGPGGHHH